MKREQAQKSNVNTNSFSGRSTATAENAQGRSNSDIDDSGLSYLLVMLLKRLAEAGNDLYNAHSIRSEKLRLAESVLSTLKELHESVAAESR